MQDQKAGVENARPGYSGLKMRDWKLQDWKM